MQWLGYYLLKYCIVEMRSQIDEEYSGCSRESQGSVDGVRVGERGMVWVRSLIRIVEFLSMMVGGRGRW